MLFLSKDKSAQTISVLGITLRVRLSYWRFMSDLEWVLDGTWAVPVSVRQSMGA